MGDRSRNGRSGPSAAWKTLDQKDYLAFKDAKGNRQADSRGARYSRPTLRRDDLRFSRHDLQSAVSSSAGPTPSTGANRQCRAASSASAPTVRRAAGLQRGLCDIPRCIHRNSDNHRGFALNRVPGFGRDVGEHGGALISSCAARRDRRDRRDRRGSLRRSGLGRTEPGHRSRRRSGSSAATSRNGKGQRVSRERTAKPVTAPLSPAPGMSAAGSPAEHRLAGRF